MLIWLYSIAIIFIIFILLVLFDFNFVYFKICSDKMPLLGAIGIIISAFIASFSVKESINSNFRLKQEEKKDKKFLELYYQRNIFIKIRETFNIIRENKGKNFLTDKALSQLKNNIEKDFICKIDSKELFSYLDKEQSGKLMNLIARLGGICNFIEYYFNDKDLGKLYEGIIEQLENHKVLSLFSAIDSLINYLDIEIEKLNNNR